MEKKIQKNTIYQLKEIIDQAANFKHFLLVF